MRSKDNGKRSGGGSFLAPKQWVETIIGKKTDDKDHRDNKENGDHTDLEQTLSTVLCLFFSWFFSFYSSFVCFFLFESVFVLSCPLFFLFFVIVQTIRSWIKTGFTIPRFPDTRYDEPVAKLMSESSSKSQQLHPPKKKQIFSGYDKFAWKDTKNEIFN